MNLNYKGWKSTRLQLTAICMVMTTIAFYKSSITSIEWLDFLKWVIGIYSTSEFGAKAATAYKERGND